MSLSVCSECRTVEGSWREPNAAERAELGIPEDSNELEDMVCCECGAIGSHKGIPEHDDYDMER